MNDTLRKRILPLALCAVFLLNLLPLALPVQAATSVQTEPKETVKTIPWKAVGEGDAVIDTTVEQHTFTFSTVPANAAELAKYKLDSPYKAMALLILALRTWTPEDPTTCLKMLDLLTDTGAAKPGAGRNYLFSEYNTWISDLKDRMTQGDKYRYIGNAYLKGATPANDYTPASPVTVTLRQSAYVPYARATSTKPELHQILVSSAGAENERYGLFFQDSGGNWKIYGTDWKNLLADVQLPAGDLLLPPEAVVPANPKTPQTEPKKAVRTVPAKAAGVDENGDPVVIDTTVREYTYTFSTVPTCYEDIVQYKLDSPYKTMALMFLAFCTWTPENPTDCARMLDYLTNTGVDSGTTDAQGRKLSRKFSDYKSWTDFLADRMNQNTKYRFIGNAYLKGATPANDYTPTSPVTITLRESTYVPYAAGNAAAPALQQVLISLAGAQNDRYSLFHQDQRGDWRVWGDNWKGLLADVQTPHCDILMPPETVVPAKPAHPQKEPVETVYDIPAKAPAVDDKGDPIVVDTTVEQHTFTFSTVPTCYEDIVQYKLDSPYKTMALMILAFRTWTPENRTDCLQMMDYLTNTNVDSGKKDANGRKLSRKFSEYQFWTDFVRDRMTQNNKYRYIGNAYLEGAMPSNDYTPTEPVTITVRQSVYDPYKASGISETDPAIRQVLISLPGAENDRYSLFYQDQRGDWRVFSDNWKGLLTDVQTPTSDIPVPPEPVRPPNPANVQKEPAVAVKSVAAKAAGVDEYGSPTVIDTTVKEYTYTFSTVPTCYEDVVQYKLDSPYKTMALLFLAYRTWTPEDPTDCLEMLDYLTNPAVPHPGVTDSEGRQVSYAFSEYNPWIAFLKDRMTQGDKYRFIGNAYLKGATPVNGYTPSSPVKITVRQSTYDPYKAASAASPEIKQVLVSFAGADNDRYALFYQDQRGDWRIYGDNWKGLLTDVKAAITGQPRDVTVAKAGDTAKFTVEAAGEGLTYQWYYKNPGGSSWGKTTASATASSYSFKVTESLDGRQVYCVVKDKDGYTVKTNTVTARIDAGPVILTQPKSVEVAKSGDTASLVTTARGVGLTYQWYYKSPSATAWTKSAGKTDTYTFAVTSSINGRQLYCEITDGQGRSVKTEVVTVTVAGAGGPVITTQPKSITVDKGEKATFTVKAAGTGLTYQWYYKNAGATAWTKSTGTTASYSFTALAATNGRQLYCEVKDSAGIVKKTGTVKLTVVTPPIYISAQPASLTVDKGEKAAFTVKASGEGLTYQWYYRNAGVTAWTKSAGTAASYSFTALGATDGRELYCEISDENGNTAKTTVVTLRLTAADLAIVTQPKSVQADKGAKATFTVKAEGSGLTYQWYYRNAGVTAWTKSAGTTASYSFTALAATDGRQLYCQVRDAAGNTVKTKTVTLTLNQTALSVTTQPKDLTVEKGAKATFTVKAAGDGLTYRWYYRNAGATAWTKSAGTTASYSFTAVAATDGRQLYCEVGDSAGNTVKTKTVTLTLTAPAITITAQPSDLQVISGDKAAFTVRAKGDDLTYRWYYKSATAKTWTQSVGQRYIYSFTVSAGHNGRQVYCEITDAAGNMVKTNTATLTVLT